MSKLVLITGGQAVGKMTVGEALRDITGFAMTMNHDSLDLSDKIFGWGTPGHKELSNSIREATFKAAINNNRDLIFTFVWAFDLKSDWDYVNHLNDLFEGELYIVELITTLETRLLRNNTAHRKEMKPSKKDIEKSNKDLIDSMEKYRLESLDDEVTFKNYIKIDNTDLSPQEVAKIIVEKFKF